MKRKLQITTLFLACGALIFSGSDLFAQGNSQGKGKGNKQKDQKEYKSEGYKAKKDDGYKKDDDYKKRDEEYKKNKQYKTDKGKKDKAYKGNAKKYPNATPRSFKVPPGHYPAAGYYRVWYPNRPPGQQPSPVRNGMPPNAPLTDGAFLIYGDKAYDTQYDWRQAEVQQKKSIPREVIDILFPSGVTPPAQ